MIPAATLSGGGQIKQGHPGMGRPFSALVFLRLGSLVSLSFETLSVLLFANFLAGALTSQRSLDTLLFTGLQVKGVAFDFFNNVFLLHLALETAQGIFEGFTLLQSNFRQTETPPNRSGRIAPRLLGSDSYYKDWGGSQVGRGKNVAGGTCKLAPSDEISPAPVTAKTL